MLYELGFIRDGQIVRGGIKADLETVGKWIEGYLKTDPDVTFFAVPADDEAITEAEFFEIPN